MTDEVAQQLIAAMQRLGDKLGDVHVALVAGIQESQLSRTESSALRHELKTWTDELRRVRHDLEEPRHTVARAAANGG